jgi:hypothetical protein
MNSDACGKIGFMQSPRTTPVGYGFVISVSDGFLQICSRGEKYGRAFFEELVGLSR